jgi:hypothetical protein
MNIVKISLSTKYDSVPAHCQIHCCDELIFDTVVDKDLDITHETNQLNQFSVRITKTGKTVEVVKKNHEQSIMIKNINLNGIDLKVAEFGKFHVKNNIYVNDHTLQTNCLNLNGEWMLELPARSIAGKIDLAKLKFRDPLEDSDIACFGCSQTYGVFLENYESWPARLQEETGKKIRNYGVRGSNINEITALVDYYIENYKTDTILLYLPHTFRRQLELDGIIQQLGTLDPRNKDLVLHGEEHSIAVISDDLYRWLDNISQNTKIYFGTYQRDEYRLYEKTPLKKFMMPFLEGNDYPKASDDLHHGAEFNRVFAKKIKEFLKNSHRI